VRRVVTDIIEEIKEIRCISDWRERKAMSR
jgi:hypothetical protein